jgi:hypothetical protein
MSAHFEVRSAAAARVAARGRGVIVVRLRFGLGNQMFQYALGRRLADIEGTRMILDTTLLQNTARFNGRRYGLSDFQIRAEVVSSTPCEWPVEMLITISEKSLGFHSSVLDCRVGANALLLEGTWQSERYFKEIEPAIRRDFTFKPFDLGDSAGVLEQIQKGNSVAVHVRRGDYVSSAVGAHLGFVGVDYYSKALAAMASSIENAHFYIFSDDIAWCRAHLPPAYPYTFVSPPDCGQNAARRDLFLMSACRHFIIANSTFSWWGAWLGNAGPSKVVIAPKRWFANPLWKLEHIIPSQWQLV